MVFSYTMRIRLFTGRKTVFNILVCTVFLAGFVLRLYFLIKYGNGITLNSDDRGYVNSARHLLGSGVLTYGDITPSVFIMPAFPLFLSLMFSLFGVENGQLAARLLQIVVNMADCYLIYLIAARFFTGKVFALVVAVIIIFYPANVIMPGLLLTETWYTAALTACVYLCILFLKKPSKKLSVALGIAFSCAMYFRPVIALVPILVCTFLFLKDYGIPFYEKLKLGFIWAVVMAVLLSPWWIRNYVDYRTFIPFTASSGNPLLYGSYINYEGIKNGNRLDWPTGKNKYETDELQKKLAVVRIKAGFKNNFWGYLRWYTVGKLERLWKQPFCWYMPPEFPREFFMNYHKLLVFTGFAGILAALTLYGKSMANCVVLMFIIYGTVINLIYVASPRYCFPQTCLLAIYSGVFLRVIRGDGSCD